ncbi:sulfatase family protein [Autumnicola musiva]|uniref:Arylsulfatase n=1 Tax=Autumnicola musiva TaxID=3075589 RepID=A0ABU3D8N9_9FLAO|nr:arylsulfatase [Zunongwangia sp. F117]MDT0677888.1 arylsulfatase [Zunongwangia sp. F117]
MEANKINDLKKVINSRDGQDGGNFRFKKERYTKLFRKIKSDMNKLFLFKILTGVTTLLLTFNNCLGQNKTPNIVIIYADDLGYGDVQSYNPERGKIPTPHIDRLAAEGMSFNDAHSSSAVCSPSRYTMLTGRYHWRSRLQNGVVGMYGDPLITPHRLTIAGLAKQNGYQTACIGKWHLGWNWPIPNDQMELFRPGKKDVTATEEHRNAWREVFSLPIPGGPTDVGFDEYFGTDIPNYPPFCFIENDRTVGIPSEFGAPRLFGWNQASIQGPARELWSLEDILPALAARSAAFIERESESSRPFLLYLPLTSPHTPLAVNDQWLGKSNLSLYADFVMETDAVVGRVLDALEKSGAEENTLVIFTSDNGCAPHVGDTTREEANGQSRLSTDHDHRSVSVMEAKGHYPSGPFRGYKSDVWEGGHRVPFIIKWPGNVQPGSHCAQLVHQADLIATIADILNVSLPANVGEDSFSLLPLMHGSNAPMRQNAISTSISGVPGLRRGNWKYIAGPGSGGWTPGESDLPVQLYNLAADPGETQNLASEESDLVKQMQNLLEKLIAEGRSTSGPTQENDVEVIRYPVKQ